MAANLASTIKNYVTMFYRFFRILFRVNGEFKFAPLLKATMTVDYTESVKIVFLNPSIMMTFLTGQANVCEMAIFFF